MVGESLTTICGGNHRQPKPSAYGTVTRKLPATSRELPVISTSLEGRCDHPVGPADSARRMEVELHRMRQSYLANNFCHQRFGTGREYSATLTTAEAQVRPAPKATKASVSPTLARPSSNASQKATGIEAAEVFPYLWMLTNTFSGGKPANRAAVSMMRIFA